MILSRATDERGQVQPTLAELGKLMGVPLDHFFTADHCNAIQVWKINRDGSIQDAVT